MTGNGRKAKVVVSGILFWYPLAGVTYQFLHYLIGLRRLGYDVYYIEDSDRWVYDPAINDINGDATSNVNAVVPILEAFGFAEKWAFRGPAPVGRSYGMPWERVVRLFGEADVFLNVTAAHLAREEQLIPRRIYIESDPFIAQVKGAAGDWEKLALLDGHDTHFTFGENVGTEWCDLPTLGIDWQPTRQPIVPELWATEADRAGDAYTTITTWHNKDKDLEWKGETYYWTKDREFRRFIELPRYRDLLFELALGEDPDALQLMKEYGWRHRNSVGLSASIDSYRHYIQDSRGEFTVARDQYVRPNTGWFSDRSACYLAAGRPVITQETGFSRHLPTGEGLFAFETMDEVLAAIDAIESNHKLHSRAAREIGVEYFGAEKVLASLMDRAGV